VWVSADFVDFEVLGQWVLTDGLTVSGIEWELDEPTREATERDVRQAALRDAVARAQDYADAIGAGPVRVTGVREPTVAHPRMMLATAEGGGQVVDIVPEPLEVAAEVQVTFVAG
jgi:hypothetical protein